MLNHSLGQKKRWAKIAKEKRSKIMRRVALKKQEQMTLEEKRAHAFVMVEARKKDLK